MNTKTDRRNYQQTYALYVRLRNSTYHERFSMRKCEFKPIYFNVVDNSHTIFFNPQFTYTLGCCARFLSTHSTYTLSLSACHFWQLCFLCCQSCAGFTFQFYLRLQWFVNGIYFSFYGATVFSLEKHSSHDVIPFYMMLPMRRKEKRLIESNQTIHKRPPFRQFIVGMSHVYMKLSFYFQYTKLLAIASENPHLHGIHTCSLSWCISKSFTLE